MLLERRHPRADWHVHRITPTVISATTPEGRLDGRIVGADGRPVERATVVIPKYDMHARTDDAGRFHLPPLPSREPAMLVVHTHGRQQSVELVPTGGRSAGIVIQLRY